MRKCSSTAILPCIASVLPFLVKHTLRKTGNLCRIVLLKQRPLPFAAAAGAAAPPRRRWRRFRHHPRVTGDGADAAIGKFNIEPHPGADRRSRPQRLTGAIAYQRKTPRQHPAIGKRREQLPSAVETREPPVENRADGALRPMRERHQALALPRNPGAR